MSKIKFLTILTETVCAYQAGGLNPNGHASERHTSDGAGTVLSALSGEYRRRRALSDPDAEAGMCAATLCRVHRDPGDAIGVCNHDRP
jgi:hypothetical protein